MEYLSDLSTAIDVISKIAGIIVLICVPYFKVLPILYRLGKGLSNREICIFSETEYDSIKKILADSTLFKEKNITQIHKADMDDAKNKSLFIVHWKDFENEIDEILRNKMPYTALIIYAEPQSISHADMAKIANKANTVVVNFKGRLLNDILTSLMTTAYQK